MLSRQGADTAAARSIVRYDLFSPVASPEPRETARGRRGASAAHARRRRCCAGGCRAAGAALSAATDTQAASTWNIRRRMFLEAASHRWWARRQRHELGISVNGIETWMTGPARPLLARLHLGRRALSSLTSTCFSVLQLGMWLETPDATRCRRAAIAAGLDSSNNPACSAAISTRLTAPKRCASYSF